MPNTAARFAPFFAPPDPVAPTPGVGGFASMLPLAEPGSVGAPPVTPGLVRALTVRHTPRVVRVRSGEVHSCALPPLTPRPEFSVRWAGLTDLEKDALVEFLELSCGAGGVGAAMEGGTLAFTIEPDGPGKGTFLARPISGVAVTQDERRLYSVEVECEQVW